MIPERAYEISSVILKTSKLFKTPVGKYSYKRLKAPYYSFGIKSITYSPKQTMLVASPEKGSSDKIVLTPKVYLRSTKQTQEFLLENLRMDSEQLKTLDMEVMEP